MYPLDNPILRFRGKNQLLIGLESDEDLNGIHPYSIPFFLRTDSLALKKLQFQIEFFFQLSYSIGSASLYSGRGTRRQNIICLRYSQPRLQSIFSPVSLLNQFATFVLFHSPRSGLFCDRT